ERANADIVSDADPGAEHDVRLDHDIAAKPGVGRQEHGFGGDQGRAFFHRAAAQPVLHQRLGRRELRAGVDAEHLFRRQLDTNGGEVAAAGDADDDGQIEFNLGVDVLQPGGEVEPT